MSVHKIAQLNALLILGIGAYALLTDEPYWRSNGHGPWLYDYLFWCALALNGPSGFAADYASWLITQRSSNTEWRFLVQYGFWLLFLWPQWKGYDAVAAWCIGHRGRETSLCLVTAGINAIGCIAAYESWIYGHRPMEPLFIDRYFWFVRIAGVALSGMVILAWSQFVKRRRAL